MKGKKIIALLLTGSMLTMTACGSGGSSQPGSSAGGGGDTAGESSQESAGTAEGAKRFEGTTLYMIAEQQTPTESLKKQLDSFKELTGITVELEMAPYDDVIQKETLAFESGSGAYDIVAAPYQFLGNMVENEYIQPIEPFMTDESLAVIDGYDESDLIKGMWDASGNWEGTLYGVPANSCIMYFAYRQDLFENEDEKASFKEKYGYDLAVPTDWDTYMDIAEFFTRPSGAALAGETLNKDFYGVSMMGKRHNAVTCEWMNYMWSFGGGIFDEEGNIAVNSDQSVEALQYFLDLSKYAPPGVTSKTWDEQTTELQQGIAAMAIQFNDCSPALEDESASLVAGKMGYGAIPVGEQPAAHYGAWGYYIPADSQNPEAAWVFLQWFNTPDVQKTIALDGGFPNLQSVYEDGDLMEIPYWKASMDAYEISTTRPRIPEWNTMDEALMLQLSNTLAGECTPKEALDNAAAEFEKALEGKLPVTYQ